MPVGDKRMKHHGIQRRKKVSSDEKQALQRHDQKEGQMEGDGKPV